MQLTPGRALPGQSAGHSHAQPPLAPALGPQACGCARTQRLGLPLPKSMPRPLTARSYAVPRPTPPSMTVAQPRVPPGAVTRTRNSSTSSGSGVGSAAADARAAAPRRSLGPMDSAAACSEAVAATGSLLTRTAWLGIPTAKSPPPSISTRALRRAAPRCSPPVIRPIEEDGVVLYHAVTAKLRTVPALDGAERRNLVTCGFSAVVHDLDAANRIKDSDRSRTRADGRRTACAHSYSSGSLRSCHRRQGGALSLSAWATTPATGRRAQAEISACAGTRALWEPSGNHVESLLCRAMLGGDHAQRGTIRP